ncbi:MAG: twin-arginine translocation protein TatB subunit [Frankiales bacterium]|nr:twin-arginine translocation protein TatB subunit [Frankiales bacterium]
MFNQLGWQEIGVILLLTLFVVGPERLPGLAADAGKQLRQVRVWLKGMSAELKTELGPEFSDVDLASLHPKTFVKKHLLDDVDDEDGTPFFSKANLTRTAEPAMVRGRLPLSDGETPPWDPDTT